MRILAFTDIHGEYAVVDSILAAEKGYHAVILGGDLTTRGSITEVEGAMETFRRFGVPVLSVLGNMDPPGLEPAFARTSTLVDARGEILDGIGFFGVSAAPFSPLHTPHEISEEEIGRRAESGWRTVANVRPTVFIPHAPPSSTRLDKTFLGRHVGSTSIRRFIEQRQPDAVVCGHIHEARGIDAIGRTRIINCGPASRGFYGVLEAGDRVTLELRQR